MDYQSPIQFTIVIADNGELEGIHAAAVLTAAGYQVFHITRDLEGLGKMTGVKPSAIIMVGFDEERETWVQPFVEDNPSAPVVLSIGDPSILSQAPSWLYDVVQASELESALVHRLNRALNYGDMSNLMEKQHQKLGLARAQISMLSMIDMVTGLFNQRYFKKHLRESFASATRYKRPLTCLLFRVDNYVELAERLGRDLANDVMDTFAHTLTSVVRRADTAAHIEENLFAFLLHETTHEGGELLKARLTSRLVRTAYPYDAEVVVSSAHAQLEPRHESPEDLLQEAIEQLPEI